MSTFRYNHADTAKGVMPSPSSFFYDWIRGLPPELKDELLVYLKHYAGIRSFTQLYNMDHKPRHGSSGNGAGEDENPVLEDHVFSLVTNFLIQRAKSVPLQYLIGEWDFLDFTLKVDKRVFIPRPETEFLVQFVFRVMGNAHNGSRTKLLCDLGTGSGCIALAFARKFQDARVLAVDISPLALQCARENAELLGMKDKIHFFQGDLLEPVKQAHKNVNVLVSNPPYVSTSEMRHLQKEIQYEPVIALDGGADGLGFYRRIAEESRDCLADNADVFVEVGMNQSGPVKSLFKKHGYVFKESCFDDQRIERCLWFGKAG